MAKDDLTPIQTSPEGLSSPTTDTLSPTWAPPKSPLPPYRLAKLANALGVSTPMPAIHGYGFASPSSPAFNQLATPDIRRSPSPSGSSFSSYQSTTSKFLLHVIPPAHLPHDSNSVDSSALTPPPSTASGYHTQFRRGTLVPVHSTLQSQLLAIAKEYALPSTAGLVLYLVTNPNSALSSPDEPPEEPGPRLSEDIWKHLWTRVWRAEREEGMPGALLGLGIDMSAQSTPPQSQAGSTTSQLRSFLSRGTDSTPSFPYPSPSSPSPSSASVSRSNSKSTAFSSSSIDTPNTSEPDDMSRANSLDLPGLSSPGIIPILAKVEFDIDKKKAGWYVPWMRSRTLNHAKRMRSRQPSGDDASESGDGSDRKPPVMLKLRAQTASPVSLVSSSADSTHPADELNAEYARLQDEQASEEDEEVKDEDYARLQDERASEEDEEVKDEDYARLQDERASEEDEVKGKDEDEEGEQVEVEDEEGSNDDDDDETARVASTDMREISGAKRKSKDPNVVELALTGGDLANLEESDREDIEGDVPEGDDVEEVKGIMERMSLESSSGKNQRSHVPPPLTLPTPSPTGTELVVPSSNSSSRASTYLPYLEKSPTEDEHDPKSHRSPTESGKRVGGVFDDLDLGLEPSLSEDVDLDLDFDDSEIPNDHRKSQFILKAQLDEIERNLNQLSPRALKIDITDEQENIVSLPFLVPGKTNADVFPPTPKNGSFDIPSDGPPRQWPAVPYSQLNEEVMPGSASTSSIPSPPRLAVNGVTTSAPKAFVANLNDDISSETLQRRKALEDDLHHYPTVGLKHGETTDSPIIPLSPDPFGRYPSTPEPSTSRSGLRQSGPLGPREPHASSVRDADSKGSRFSTDSVSQVAEDKKPNNRTTILSTKSIRKLWRRSNNKSLSNISVHSADKVPPPPLSSRSKNSMDSLNPPTPGLSSGRSSPTPSRPPRPSEEDMDIPDIPPQMAIPLHPDSGRPAPMPIIAAQMQRERSRSALDNLHFDQESPYPMTRRSPAPPPPAPKEPFVPGDASRTSVRKSILKWKAGTSGSGGKSSVDLRNDSTNAEATPVNRPERTSSSAPRARRPSVLGFGSSSRLSQTSPPPSIPPSPRIPEQYLNQQNTNGAHLRNGSSATHLTTSSIETRVDSLMSSTARTQSSRTTVRSPSPSHSMASGKSRTSEEGSDARPSIDESQFEMVSPPMGVSQQLSYPYHDLDAPA